MDEALRESKRRLRRALRARRERLDATVVEAAGRRIAERLATMPAYSEAAVIHTYIESLPGEIPTRPIVRAALAAGRRVVCPRVASREPPALEHFEITGLDGLSRAPTGLWEPDPKLAIRVDADLPDVVLVPGLGFDRDGRRLGHGGGFYDRFLAPLRAPRLGLAFSLQIIDWIPHSPRDEDVDWIVTEEAVLGCRRARPGSQQDPPM